MAASNCGIWLYVFALGLLATPAVAGPPAGSTEIEGQKVLTLVVREPPVLRCNNNLQVASELANLYKVPILALPASLAPWSKAPAVYYGEQLIAEDGGDFNGMVSFDQLRDVIEIEGAPKQERGGRLTEVKTELDALKAAIKGASEMDARRFLWVMLAGLFLTGASPGRAAGEGWDGWIIGQPCAAGLQVADCPLRHVDHPVLLLEDGQTLAFLHGEGLGITHEALDKAFTKRVRVTGVVKEGLLHPMKLEILETSGERKFFKGCL